MTFWEVCAYVLALAILLVIIRIFIKPIGSAMVLILSSVLGGAGLYLYNMAAGYFGASLGINVVTSAICGVLGVPGLASLVVIKVLLGS